MSGAQVAEAVVVVIVEARAGEVALPAVVDAVIGDLEAAAAACADMGSHVRLSD